MHVVRRNFLKNNKSATLIFGTLEYVPKGQLLIAYRLKKTSWQTLGKGPSINNVGNWEGGGVINWSIADG